MGKYKVKLTYEEEFLIEDALDEEDAEEQSFKQSQIIKYDLPLSAIEVRSWDKKPHDVWIGYQDRDKKQNLDYHYFRVEGRTYNEACLKATTKFYNLFDCHDYMITDIKIKEVSE